MKIVRIIARLNVGGPARHVTWLNQELQDDRFSSVLVAGTVPAGEEDMSYLASEGNTRTYYISEMSRELSWKDLIALYKIYRVLRREKPDVVHTHTAKAGTVGRAAALVYKFTSPLALLRGKGVKVVHTFHGHVFHSYYGPRKTRFFIAIEKILARFATDKIVTISDQQRREINEDFGIGRPEEFETIPLGIDIEALAATGSQREVFRREMAASADELLVGFVGRLTEIKNLSMLIEVIVLYSLQSATAEPKLKFVIVGDGHLRQDLESQASARGVRDLVAFAGNRTDVADVYAGIDIVALTSLNEGTPLSLIEAMAAERPFVATSVGGVVDLAGEVVEDHFGFKIHDRGLTAASGDAAGFLNGLLHLAGNENLRISISRSGRKFVGEKYAKSRLVNDIKELYLRLAG